jgi:hypothetical protein
MILYLYARMGYGPDDPGKAEEDRRCTAAALAMQKSAYPVFRRYVALYKAGERKAILAGDSAPVRAETEKLLDAAVSLLAKSLQEDDLGPNPDQHGNELIETVQKAYGWLSGNKLDAYQRVHQILIKSSVKCPAVLPFMFSAVGEHWTNSAWEARGTGYAKTVTDEGWKLFHQRLRSARDSLQRAWDLNPRDGEIAKRMMWVVLGLQLGRAEMDKWFERAMKADPDNREACLVMMEYLEPKWHGSSEELMAFGRACAATKNWRSGIPLLLADAHRRASYYVDEAKRNEYFASTAVYGEIQNLFSEYLKHRPDDTCAQSQCAMYCYLCGQFEEADKHFQKVGDHLWSGDHFSMAMMKDARAKTSLAKQVKSQPGNAESASQRDSHVSPQPPNEQASDATHPSLGFELRVFLGLCGVCLLAVILQQSIRLLRRLQT